MFRVRVWNVDHMANAKIKANNGILEIITKLREAASKLDPIRYKSMHDVIANHDERIKLRKTSSRKSKALRNFLADKEGVRYYSSSACIPLPGEKVLENKNQLITILTRRAVNPKPFSTMDIETVSYKGHQIPLMISCKVTSQTKVFRVKRVGLESVFYMWLDFFDYLESKSEDKTNYILLIT
uniref:DNA polymerase n=1 Tax=Ganoderma tsugae TaxID=2075311 RepID=A0A2S1WBE9_GANTS|nr:DNA polymerase [Ganoderma tsugae]AWJ63879.1 DNA polymerase [Ganoderma tsugae]